MWFLFKKTGKQEFQSNSFLIQGGCVYFFGESKRLLHEISTNISENTFFELHNFFPKELSSRNVYQKVLRRRLFTFSQLKGLHIIQRQSRLIKLTAMMFFFERNAKKTFFAQWTHTAILTKKYVNEQMGQSIQEWAKYDYGK